MISQQNNIIKKTKNMTMFSNIYVLWNIISITIYYK